MKRTFLFFLISVCSYLVSAHSGHHHEQNNGNIDNEYFYIIADRIKIEPKKFSPSDNEEATLSFRLKNDADITVCFYDEFGNLVKEIKEKNLMKGNVKFKWDGKDINGRQCKGEVFVYTISAVTGDREYIYNPAFATGGKRIKTTQYSLDKLARTLDFILPKASYVRITPHLGDIVFDPIINYQPMLSGEYSIDFDGFDSSGNFDMWNSDYFNPLILCYTLPDNSIIFDGKINFDDNWSNYEKVKRTKIWGSGDIHCYSINPDLYRKIDFEISYPKSCKDSDGLFVVSRADPIRIQVEDKLKQYLLDKGCNLQMFIDTSMITKIENVKFPSNLYIDSECILDGYVCLTLILSTDDGYTKTITQNIKLEN